MESSTPNDDAIALARSARRADDWHRLGLRARTGILRAIALVLFGTSERAGLVDEFRALKLAIAFIGGGSVTLQFISTFNLQHKISAAIAAVLAALLGGH